MRHTILIGALVGIRHQHLVGLGARNLLSTAHGNHATVQQLAKDLQLRGDAGAVSLIIPVDVLPLTLAN
jgi:hypothetical protein